MRALLLLLASCAADTIPEFKPPNAEACDRAIECGIAPATHRPQCLKCVDLLIERNPGADFEYWLKKLPSASCADLAYAAAESGVAECIKYVFRIELGEQR